MSEQLLSHRVNSADTDILHCSLAGHAAEKQINARPFSWFDINLKTYINDYIQAKQGGNVVDPL